MAINTPWYFDLTTGIWTRFTSGDLVRLGATAAGLRYQFSSSFIEARDAIDVNYVNFAADTVRAYTRFNINNVCNIEQSGTGFRFVSNTGSTVDIRAKSLFLDTDLTIIQNRFAVSASVPANPAVGTQWLELSGTLPVYNWWWTWNGTYWLSPRFTRELFVTAPFSVDSGFYLFLDQILNTFLEYFSVVSFVAGTNNATNYWNQLLYRTAANNAQVLIASATTAAATANTWAGGGRISINQHLDVAALGAKILQFSFFRNNTPGAIYPTGEIAFRYARP